MRIYDFIRFCIDFKLNDIKTSGPSVKEIFTTIANKDGYMILEDFTLALEMLAIKLLDSNHELPTT